jgi:hypothetical protein
LLDPTLSFCVIFRPILDSGSCFELNISLKVNINSVISENMALYSQIGNTENTCILYIFQT